jgi:hypothetical protein
VASAARRVPATTGYELGRLLARHDDEPALAAAVAVTGIVWTMAFGTYADVVITGLVVGGGAAAIITVVLWPRLERRLGRRAA